MNKTTNSGAEPGNGSKWKTVLIVLAVVAFLLWAASGDDGYDGGCTRLGNGAEWGSDC